MTTFRKSSFGSRNDTKLSERQQINVEKSCENVLMFAGYKSR